MKSIPNPRSITIILKTVGKCEQVDTLFTQLLLGWVNVWWLDQRCGLSECLSHVSSCFVEFVLFGNSQPKLFIANTFYVSIDTMYSYGDCVALFVTYITHDIFRAIYGY